MADDECERSVVGRGGALKKDGEKKKVLVESHRPLHALGIRRGPQGGKVVEHATDETAVYLVGSQVAIYSCETHNHRFLPTGTKTVEVLAFSVSHNKRYIALSERILEDKTGDVGVQVSVFNFGTMARIRTLSMTCLNKKAPATLDFSRDNKYLVTATPAPDAALYLWQLDKARLLGMSELPSEVCRATISPWAHWSFCSTGDKICRMWRYQDKQLKATDPMAKKQVWSNGCYVYLRTGDFEHTDFLIHKYCEKICLNPPYSPLSFSPRKRQAT
ncbi:hypothetical protein DIPPA_14307 [Diplonema papillatum]|nr:hypothetical protein DIPPA_14307 [Diplonema papillatum]